VRGHGKVPKHKLKVVANPLEEEEDVVVLPPLKPDVALIHAQYVVKTGRSGSKDSPLPMLNKQRRLKRFW
jgi:acyl CoA:acetate/3-ketoacid CoA transferase alpha subunit